MWPLSPDAVEHAVDVKKDGNGTDGRDGCFVYNTRSFYLRWRTLSPGMTPGRTSWIPIQLSGRARGLAP